MYIVNYDLLFFNQKAKKILESFRSLDYLLLR